MANKRDYYEVLGISRDAGEDDIRKAYRKLARQFHPDVNKSPEAEQMFKEATEAYEHLGDPDKRSHYDAFGHGGGDVFGGAGGSPFEGFGFGGLADVFDAFFGGGGRRNRTGPQQGDDIRLDMEISFVDAVFGAEIETPGFEHWQSCDTCGGTGAASATSVVKCKTCSGRGVVEQAHRTPFGVISQRLACPRCHGEGQVIEHPCTKCEGRGQVVKKRKEIVRIPGGVDSGTRVKVTGMGNAGRRGGAPGDLYIFLFVQDDPERRFERHDYELYTQVAIGYTQAVLGDEIEVPVLQNPHDSAAPEAVPLRIPPGTQSGQVFVVRGHGVPERGNRRGDLHVKVVIDVPKKVSKEEAELLKQLAAVSDGNAKRKPFVMHSDEREGKGKKSEEHSFLGAFKKALKDVKKAMED